MTLEPLLWLHCSTSGRCLSEYIIGTQWLWPCDRSRSGRAAPKTRNRKQVMEQIERREATRHPKSETRDPGPETRDPKSENQKPNPETWKLKLDARSPKSDARTRNTKSDARNTKPATSNPPSSDDVQETSVRYRSVEPEQWLQRHPVAGSFWPC